MSYRLPYFSNRLFFISPAFLLSKVLLSGMSFSSGTPVGGGTSGLQAIALVVREIQLIFQ